MHKILHHYQKENHYCFFFKLNAIFFKLGVVIRLKFFRLVFLMEKTFPESKTKVVRRISEEPLAMEAWRQYNDYFSGNWIQLNLNIY